MARKRMIDPNFWRDEKIAKCVFMERLLFQGLWTLAEDHGAGRANPLLIKADIFPYDTTLREADIEKSLVKLASLGLIILYEIDAQKYYYVINFVKHQTINKPSKTTIPLPLPEHYSSTTVATTVVVTPEVKLIEENIKEGNTIGDSGNPELAEHEKLFEEVWKLYPKKKGKGGVSVTQKKKLLKIGSDELARCIERYRDYIIDKDDQFVMHGSTFFNGGYVDYMDKNYEP